jgi:hypothetical protein
MDGGDFYWCLEHQQVEQGPGCRVDNRLGPYPTAEDATNWRQRVDARNEDWEEEDERWERGGRRG